jgi:hypothetical protein
LGGQVYGLWTSPYDRRAGRQYSNFSRVQLLREIMVRHGDADKPIWATEVGWNAQPEDLAAAANFGRVSEAQQAEYAVAAYARAAQEWPWLGVMNYWFFRRATDSEQDQPMYYFRAMEPDFTPLPVWGALSTMATEDPTVSIGFYQENHWALDYAGGGQTIHDSEAVQGAYLLGQEGDELSFTFEGTDLKLVLREASQANRLAVTVDGEIAAMGRVSTAPYTDAPAVSLARNLADGRHRVTLRVSGGPGGLAGLVVTRRAMSLQAVVALAAGGATLLAALLGWRVRLRRRRRAPRSPRPAGTRHRANRDGAIERDDGVTRRQREWLLLILILALAAGLRLYRLDAQSLWNDEGTSVALAGRSLAAITQGAAADIHPPSYYYLLHYWLMLAGNSEFGARSLSALAGVALVGLVYALGRGSLAAHRAAGRPLGRPLPVRRLLCPRSPHVHLCGPVGGAVHVGLCRPARAPGPRRPGHLGRGSALLAGQRASRVQPLFCLYPVAGPEPGLPGLVGRRMAEGGASLARRSPLGGTRGRHCPGLRALAAGLLGLAQQLAGGERSTDPGHAVG